MIHLATRKSYTFDLKEDFLTSSVFDFLLLLEDKKIWDILRKSIFQHTELPKVEEVGELHIECWPHWQSVNTDNTHYVEPDFFLSFDELDVIIEAKRYDENQQYSPQWEKEIRSYLNEYRAENKEKHKPVILLALGGIHTQEPNSIINDEFWVYKSTWTNILKTIKSELKSNQLPTIETRIYKKLIDVFNIFGFHTADWMGLNINSLSMPIQETKIALWKPSKFSSKWKGFYLMKYIKMLDNKKKEILNLWKIT